MTEHVPTGRRSSPPIRRILQGLGSLVLIVAIFWFLFKGIAFGQVWAAIRALTWLEVATLAVVAGWNLCTYALVWMSVTPGLGFWPAMVMTQSTTAVANTVPGAGPVVGIGMTYGMLGSWGYSRSKTTTAVLVSGVWNSFIKLGLPVLALALVALQGNAGGGRVIAALAGIGGLVAAVMVFALMLRSEDGARRFGVPARPHGAAAQHQGGDPTPSPPTPPADTTSQRRESVNHHPEALWGKGSTGTRQEVTRPTTHPDWAGQLADGAGAGCLSADSAGSGLRRPIFLSPRPRVAALVGPGRG
jgi:lysylphosphatidylglycerol synthase-like protein